MKTVMLIDDDADDRFLFSDAIQGVAQCITCESPEEGISKLSEHSCPDFLFLDINMPIMTGFECLEHIRKNKNHDSVHIVMYSTSNLQEDIAMSKKLGANFYFAKPYSYEDLKKGLRLIINGEPFTEYTRSGNNILVRLNENW